MQEHRTSNCKCYKKHDTLVVDVVDVVHALHKSICRLYDYISTQLYKEWVNSVLCEDGIVIQTISQLSIEGVLVKLYCLLAPHYSHQVCPQLCSTGKTERLASFTLGTYSKASIQ